MVQAEHSPGPSPGFDAFLVRQEPGGLSSGVERLAVSDLPDGEVLVEVAWSGVNYKDAMVTRPGNRVARRYPLVPGVDLAGTVVSSDHPDFVPGQQVLSHGHELGVSRHGGFAELARLPAEWVLALPEGLDARQAMGLGTAGFTAALSVDELERHGLSPGAGPVLVTGAAGGVGSMAVSMLGARGYEVVASTGRRSEAAWLQDLGATEVVDRQALEDAPDRLLGAERWAGAVDCVGGATLARVLRTLRYGAAVAASGLTGGAELETTVFPFITRQVALLGVDSVATGLHRRVELWRRLGADLRPRRLDLLVGEEVTLQSLADPLSRILQGQVRGRVVVRVAA